jgi:hypothetical protein
MAFRIWARGFRCAITTKNGFIDCNFIPIIKLWLFCFTYRKKIESTFGKGMGFEPVSCIHGLVILLLTKVRLDL